MSELAADLLVPMPIPDEVEPRLGVLNVTDGVAVADEADRHRPGGMVADERVALAALAVVIFGWAILLDWFTRHDLTGPLVFMIAGLVLANSDWGTTAIGVVGGEHEDGFLAWVSSWSASVSAPWSPSSVGG